MPEVDGSEVSLHYSSMSEMLTASGVVGNQVELVVDWRYNSRVGHSAGQWILIPVSCHSEETSKSTLADHDKAQVGVDASSFQDGLKALDFVLHL